MINLKIEHPRASIAAAVNDRIGIEL